MRKKSGSLAPFQRAAAIFTAIAGSAMACVEDVDLGQFQAPSASAAAGGSAGTTNVGVGGALSEAGAGGAAECVQTTCGGNLYACGDCYDNDQDGEVDAEDSQCLGPCDNTEDSFYGGIPGQNNAPCRQDCYFDSDTGPGNDDCYWSHRCDALSVADEYPPSGDGQCAFDAAANISGTAATCAELAEEQTPVCAETCLPLVPNGCDCFGCCELPAGSGSFVWIGSTTNGVGSCSEATLDDPLACRPCTPVTSCFNQCGDCELCAGRAEPAESCGAPDDNACGDQYQACGREDQTPCPPGTYCITGCCISIPK